MQRKYFKYMLIILLVLILLFPNISKANENLIGEEENQNQESIQNQEYNEIKENNITQENVKDKELTGEQNINQNMLKMQTEEDKTYLNIDYPNTEIINSHRLYIDGWIMSTNADKKLEIYIDGKIQQADIITRKRPDVIAVINGYGTLAENPEPGFKTTLDLKNIKNGEHTLTIKSVSNTGKELAVVNKKIKVNKYQTCLNIDYPNTKQIRQDSLYIDGWVMSTCENKKIEIYIDGKKQQANIATRKRADVIAVIHGYGTLAENPEPGFKTALDLKQISDGNHNLKIRVVSENGEELSSVTKNINIQKYQTQLNIDYPKTDNINSDELCIDGWVMSTNSDKKIEIYLNDKLQETQIVTRKRQDVISAIHGYGTLAENPEPGFKTTLDLKNIIDGKYTLKIKVVTSDGTELASNTRNITIRKYPTNLNIDYPKTNNIREDKLYIDGWIMSTCENKKINIYIDGKLREEQIVTRKRPDVIAGIKGYGTLAENPEPGFKTTIDLKQIEDGTHTLKIEVVSGKGEKLATYERKINLTKYPTTMYIDRPVENFTTGKNQIEVSGWVMSKYPNAEIKIYVNGNLQTSEITRRTRNDVINAIKDFGTIKENPEPGFSAKIDISTLEEKAYQIRVDICMPDGKILSTSKTNFIINRKVLRGIDVSEHNGTIDWEKVKNEIDFAIIRCGYGEDTISQDDKTYLRNVMECERLGIPYGVYIYSYAINLDKAKSEVNHVIRLLKNKKTEYGIWFDMEDADGYKSRHNVSDQMCRDITYTFCSIMKSKGYNVGIYANYNWFTNILNDERLDQYPKWVAQWGDKCDYKKEYVMWQYTNSGNVSGISGRVDMDYYYR